MPAFDEELFGPVAAIISARDENEAITIANNTAFGLGAAVFTQDIKKWLGLLVIFFFSSGKDNQCPILCRFHAP